MIRNITPELQKAKDRMAKKLFGGTVTEAHETDCCIKCKEPALEKCYSAAGKKEFRISGLCELCFDEICGTSKPDIFIPFNKEGEE